ncbi:MAG: RAMP superfamily protein [Methanosaeta sp. PtaB.Bin018]|nr:MAG: RAMP superfamily protein [Methanosaeta sp. PtaB.Bin018]
MTYQPDVTKYFALALDPVHVGTGDMRLGRVDMSIVREPGTNLPKIPGTSIAGACRTYATMQQPNKWPGCAGQGQAKGNYQGHCGGSNCPICVTFGFSKGEGGSFQGLAQFTDARLVFFPVHSLAGPVWVTCPSVLRDLKVNGDDKFQVEDYQVRLGPGVKASGRLNLGWMMLDVVGNAISLNTGKFPGVPTEILNRAVLVSDKMFSHIVNDNLEVRTSVSIDPQTGAAADGALFTYEALPRCSVLVFEAVISDPKFYCIAGKVPLSDKNCTQLSNQSIEEQGQSNGRKQVRETVESGLRLFKTLGIGGMNTRGMGRLDILNLNAGGGQ